MIAQTTLGIVQLIILLGLFGGLAAALFHMLDVTFDGEESEEAFDEHERLHHQHTFDHFEPYRW